MRLGLWGYSCTCLEKVKSQLQTTSQGANMTVHLEPPPATIDALAALRQRNAELELQLAECRAAQQNLQMQADIFSQTMDQLDELVIIKGPKSRIVYGNKAFRDLYGM